VDSSVDCGTATVVVRIISNPAMIKDKIKINLHCLSLLIFNLKKITEI